MSELQKRLEKLLIRLDHMGLRVDQLMSDALRSLMDKNIEAANQVDRDDSIIDREEVEIEQECIRLLALYQPAAVDLRTICMVIKANNDLERIADKAASISRRVKHVVAEHLDLKAYPGFEELVHKTREVLRKTVGMLNQTDPEVAKSVIKFDHTINQAYKDLVRNILDNEAQKVGGAETALTWILLARALERVGDLCVNIAEDVIFLRTGDIVRHPEAFDTRQPN